MRRSRPARSSPRPDEAIHRLASEGTRLGIDLLVTRPQLAGLDEDALALSLERLATEVWPEALRRA